MANGLFKKLKRSNGVKFILYPIVFFILSCLILILALAPLMTPVFSIWDMITLAEPPAFNQEDAPITLNENATVVEKIVVPSDGEQYGEMEIPSAGIKAPVYYGDDAKTLRKGVGTYAGTYIPGQRRTILMAAHNNTYFHTLGEAQVGDQITITTTYGKYVYEITGSQVALATDKTAYDLTKEEENLILYTCYPFNALGITNRRYFVYAKYVSGPQVPLETEGGN